MEKINFESVIKFKSTYAKYSKKEPLVQGSILPEEQNIKAALNRRSVESKSVNSNKTENVSVQDREN